MDMESKTTIRRVSRSEFRSSQSNQAFTLYGTVIKVSKKTNSILVEKGGSTTSFWLSCHDDVIKYAEFGKYKFTILISTYWSKKDATLQTSLRVIKGDILTDEDKLQEGFEVVHMPVKILSSEKTEVPGLYVLTVRRMDEGQERETYHLRYFNKENLHTDLGVAIIRFTVNKTKDIIDERGDMKVDIETRTFINAEGEYETIESPLYKPCLSILEIIR